MQHTTNVEFLKSIIHSILIVSKWSKASIIRFLLLIETPKLILSGRKPLNNQFNENVHSQYTSQPPVDVYYVHWFPIRLLFMHSILQQLRENQTKQKLKWKEKKKNK